MSCVSVSLPAAKRSQSTAREVDAELRSALSDYRRAEQRTVLCFAEVVERNLFREPGYATIFQYASESLGFSAKRTFGFLRLAEAFQRLPELRAALMAGAIGWTKAREIIKVAGPKNVAKWLELAKGLSRRELEAKVLRARQRRVVARKSNPAQRALAPKPVRLPPRTVSAPEACSPEQSSLLDVPDDLVDESPEPITYRLTPTQLARYEALIEKVHKLLAAAPGSSREEILLAGLEALVESASSELSSRGDNATPYRIVVSECPTCKRARLQTNRGTKRIAQPELETMKCDAILEDEEGRRRRTIPPRTRRAVLKRDQHRCQAPGCTNARFLEIHHVRARQNGGSNDLQNLVTLCSRCHRMMHERALRRELFRGAPRPASQRQREVIGPR